MLAVLQVSKQVHPSDCTGHAYSGMQGLYKGKGGAANDQSDAGCKGNRQIHVDTCMFLLKGGGL